MTDDRAAAGTAEGQGPVQISADLADRLEERRAELFEKFEIHDGFPPAVRREAEARTEAVTEEIQEELTDRSDLRDLTTWTTDPVDAQDFDDAISIADEGDAYRLWVHIADVTHYVHPDSEMWEHAIERGTRWDSDTVASLEISTSRGTGPRSRGFDRDVSGHYRRSVPTSRGRTFVVTTQVGTAILIVRTGGGSANPCTHLESRVHVPISDPGLSVR